MIVPGMQTYTYCMYLRVHCHHILESYPIICLVNPLCMVGRALLSLLCEMLFDIQEAWGRGKVYKASRKS